jgi:hypothetical protein
MYWDMIFSRLFLSISRDGPAYFELEADLAWFARYLSAMDFPS